MSAVSVLAITMMLPGLLVRSLVVGSPVSSSSMATTTMGCFAILTCPSEFGLASVIAASINGGGLEC